MSCGCKQANESHGDDRNITLRDIQDAAAAAKTDVQGVMINFKQDFDLVAAGTRGSGQDRKENRGQYSDPVRSR